jgi:hypothetical protein
MFPLAAELPRGRFIGPWGGWFISSDKLEQTDLSAGAKKKRAGNPHCGPPAL